MAPECLNGKEYCEKADVFSYGIILAEMLAQIPADPEFMPRTKVRHPAVYTASQPASHDNTAHVV